MGRHLSNLPAEMSRGFPDGAWLVLLASISDPLLVTQAVFGALGVHDLSAGLSLSSLTDYLAGKRLASRAAGDNAVIAA